MTGRKAVRAGAGWLFGLATTIFLIAVWGRAVVVDTDSLAQAAAPLTDSALVVDLFTSWLDREMVDAGVDPQTAELVVEDFLGRSAVAVALERFMGELVVAAASPLANGGAVDVGSLLLPAVPEIEEALAAGGVSVPDSRISQVVAGLDPLVVRSPGSPPHIGPASPTAGHLGIAAVLSLLGMAVFGWAAVAASDDRLGEARNLFNRVALGALSFAIILATGSWVLDPDGGRAPVAESASIVAASNWLLPLTIGFIAGAIGLAIWGLRRVLRRRAESRSSNEPPTRPEERPLIRSG